VPEHAKTFEFVEVPDKFYNKAKYSDHALILPPYNLEKMRSKGLSFTVLKEFPITGSLIVEFARETKKQ
jgi:hypothetical protein